MTHAIPTSNATYQSRSGAGRAINNKKLKNDRFEKLGLPSPKLNKRYRFSVIPTNEELNNKIDLEIRILDGILKLLNAICLSPITTSLANSTLQLGSNQSTIINNSNSNSNSSQTALSILINTFEPAKCNDVNKCTALGAAIAAAIISNKNANENANSNTLTTSQITTVSNNMLLENSSAESNHIFQILTACKCLFVSHRKIAIYLESLNELENMNKKISLNDSNEDEENNENININDEKDVNANQNEVSIKSLISDDSSLVSESCKLMLSDLRVPSSWKWNDYIKASKNSENVSAKFATFALIYLGNMIYDTQLISNVDATMTDITFNESFVFDDVKQSKFEILIEFYSYELFNAANNILQSARKIAKQFADFATFKRNSQQGTIGSSFGQQQSYLNLANSTSNYPQSIHKFKLIARASLNQEDISEQVSTKCLKLVNDSIMEQPSTNGNALNGNNIQLPLFDYYSCRLKILPTSSFI